MPDRRLSRFVAEVIFLVALAVGLALADVEPLLIAAIMAGGWVLVALLEWLASREEPHYGSGLPPRYYVPQVSLPPRRPLEQVASGYPDAGRGEDAPTWIAPAALRADLAREWPVAAPTPGEDTQEDDEAPDALPQPEPEPIAIAALAVAPEQEREAGEEPPEEQEVDEAVADEDEVEPVPEAAESGAVEVEAEAVEDEVEPVPEAAAEAAPATEEPEAPEAEAPEPEQPELEEPEPGEPEPEQPELEAPEPDDVPRRSLWERVRGPAAAAAVAAGAADGDDDPPPQPRRSVLDAVRAAFAAPAAGAAAAAPVGNAEPEDEDVAPAGDDDAAEAPAPPRVFRLFGRARADDETEALTDPLLLEDDPDADTTRELELVPPVQTAELDPGDEPAGHAAATQRFARHRLDPLPETAPRRRPWQRAGDDGDFVAQVPARPVGPRALPRALRRDD